ncbi:alanyl-tRNA synthetase [Candidatus Kinetoplastibacterium oncopeltii TCC290E]|uniref:Alanine--tRNA ligase n=1 Tax=Candidatus Kinetoplastidibacterium stringomonadis TCC290E TaxID=1208920 RepID=M1LS68_9PROT|nr:alanine--tRNA ligase [Candidatus Kinetoplastibacterium oncopeltii]AGF48392.1 alanyl-tRNA synthetase [Candidatus Kinetoplastibacterium oncopeltii TCC290E]
MKTSDIRIKFLKFFESKGHTILPSSSLIPTNDQTLLFTNSGMVQFKDIFTGHETSNYKSVTTAQRCFRAGGKHNDLENVGYTARHHTFFEMLGNFSFGEYFKKEAIHYAWELLTSVYKIPKDKLLVTVYYDDNEAYDIWNKEIGLNQSSIIRIGDNKGSKYASDNFWQMADVGPCGPCSEIFYDHGPNVDGGPPGSDNSDGDRYVEIWNLVFMQFYIDVNGNITNLMTPCIDTGMGLERIAAVLQGVHSNYDIDLFKNLIKSSARMVNIDDLSNSSLKVIADHIRATAFLIVDGVLPANDGRGYVLRRIIRRALRHAYKLGENKVFLHKLIPDLIQEMGTAYPEIISGSNLIVRVLKQEEERFIETLSNGMKILNNNLNHMKSGDMLSGDILFNLYDTYGFPADLTADVCREQNISVDIDSFELEMSKQRDKARLAGKFKNLNNQINYYDGPATIFDGYKIFDLSAKVVAIYSKGKFVNSIVMEDSADIVLDRTPFYAESGGQVGDKGFLISDISNFRVNNTTLHSNVFMHHGYLESGSIRVGDILRASIDIDNRKNISRNHSATHIMHKALRTVLGTHALQKGSLVDSERIRFDFSHDFPVSIDQIKEVEKISNEEILSNSLVNISNMDYCDAISIGAIAVFSEKYENSVRVVNIGSSLELCCGTHVNRTGDIGFLKIISESSVSAGIRRIDAVTGNNTLRLIQDQQDIFLRLSSSLNTNISNITTKVDGQINYIKNIEKKIYLLEKNIANVIVDNFAIDKIKFIKDIGILISIVHGLEHNVLCNIVDSMKSRFQKTIVLLASVSSNGKVNVVCGISNAITNLINAKDIISLVLTKINGKGGGRNNMATGSGYNDKKLPDILDNIFGFIKEKI